MAISKWRNYVGYAFAPFLPLLPNNIHIEAVQYFLKFQ